jgi:hypothetical protein
MTSFGPAGDVLYYSPYQCYFPTTQTKLLMLWDELRIPHKERKQVYGPIVTFIGFDVDPNAMSISLSLECRTKVFNKICDFTKPGK